MTTDQPDRERVEEFVLDVAKAPEAGDAGLVERLCGFEPRARGDWNPLWEPCALEPGHDGDHPVIVRLCSACGGYGLDGDLNPCGECPQGRARASRLTARPLLPTAGDEGGEGAFYDHERKGWFDRATGERVPDSRLIPWGDGERTPAPTPPVEGAQPEVVAPLRVCDQSHGLPSNDSTVYGRHAAPDDLRECPGLAAPEGAEEGAAGGVEAWTDEASVGLLFGLGAIPADERAEWMTQQVMRIRDEAVAAAERAAEVRALNEAANEIDTNTFVSTDRDVTAWLRRRAAGRKS